MTDVRTEDAPATSERNRDPTGDFIWYELLTSDADGAKAFYDSVVGWNIDAQASFPNGYRMIGRSDGTSKCSRCNPSRPIPATLIRRMAAAMSRSCDAARSIE